MSAPAYAGEVRLGVPHDIVGALSCRRSSSASTRPGRACAWPSSARTTPQLRRADAQGRPRPHADHRAALRARRRNVAGGRPGLGRRAVNGAAHRRDPLPVSLGDENCEFRPRCSKALAATAARLAAGVRGLRHGAAAGLPRSRPGGRARSCAARSPTIWPWWRTAPATAAEVPDQHVPAAGAAERDRRGAGAAHRPGVRHPLPPPSGPELAAATGASRCRRRR